MIDWASIIGSASQGAADIISATKGNYSKTQNTVALGSNVTPAGGAQSLVPLLLFGGLALFALKMFKR